ncbi:phenylalanine 2-monooxygenase precursor-like [Planococcus citri]|uniref:phenylalanine 2-monooxygenase precursor-like n=1 Tax=Planococcus citri TaxID=170843 RepID=UPI0031F78120
MGISVIPSLLDEKNVATLGAKTIAEICKTGRYYRHPDSALISYPLVVADKIGKIPDNKELKIAVIGAGVGGIASCYELSRLGNSDKIHVTLYESDPENFIFAPPVVKVKTAGLKTGRVFAARSQSSDTNQDDGDKDSKPGDKTVYEIGAMRFPEIAGLTWHYANSVFKEDTKVDAFPNPGTVATEFVFGDRSDRYSRDDGWLKENSPTERVYKVVRAGIFGPPEKETPCYFLIGGKNPCDVSEELKKEYTNTEDKKRLEEINQEWKEFAIKYDGLTLEAAIRQIIRAEVEKGTLPDIEGLAKGEAKVNYYTELFGCFGFGTGGFKSISNQSLTEMMRILLWDYANEYTLPVNENVDFIAQLYQKAKIENKLNVDTKCARVCDVCHEASTDKALVFSYNKTSTGSGVVVEDTLPDKQEFDYVILAVTPKQMNSIISRAGFSNAARKIRFGDYNRQYPDEVEARPPLTLSKNYDTPNSEIFTAVNQIHMMSSSKIFVTIKEDDFLKYAPNFKKEGNKIKAIVSDCGLACSYIVPSPFSKPIVKDGVKYYSLLLSYNWEEDTKRIQHHLYEYPINKYDDSAANKKMIEAAINRTIREVRDPEDGTYKPWWFGELLSKSVLSDPLSHDWTTDYSAGGFKLDTTGNHYNSNLCFRYHTHAVDPTLKNRFFVAGDSYSHLGGWIEGAFMSAINAVTGLVVAANDGDIGALEPEARKVITTLDKVVSA